MTSPEGAMPSPVADGRAGRVLCRMVERDAHCAGSRYGERPVPTSPSDGAFRDGVIEEPPHREAVRGSLYARPTSERAAHRRR
jgi:hypothetical protein